MVTVLLIVMGGLRTIVKKNLDQQVSAHVPVTLERKDDPAPEGWIEVIIKNKVALKIPPDMKKSGLVGDSEAYREAYKNSKIGLAIVYGSGFPRSKPEHLDKCENPDLIDNPAYQESDLEIDGRKAKLGIDRQYQAKFLNTIICFPKTETREALRVVAFCDDEPALQTAMQIFKSIKFKD
jgi:hypothetical protein